MSAAAPQLARTRRKGEITAERVLDAAEGLFAERGYAGTTLRDVSAAVGIRTPSLYNHFAGKEALYGAVLERGIRPLLEALSEFVSTAGGEPVEPRQLAIRMVELLAERPQLPRLIQHEILAGGERLTPMLRRWIVPVFTRAGEMARQSPGAARWDAEQLPLLVLAMYHVIVGYFTMAPLWAELNGTDLLSAPQLERQTALFGEIVEVLFQNDPPAPSPEP